jgi:processive 1,2-diacylglycerol beta-glucosyltransferase
MNGLLKALIIYADSGAGHRRAAEALYEAMKRYYSPAEVDLIDVLDYTTPMFRKNYSQIYLLLVKYVPWLWGFCFSFLDHNFIDRIAKAVRRVNNHFYCRKFEKYILARRPNLVLTTHFLPNEIITSLKRRRGFEAFLVTCITDYYPHIFWRDAGIDLYITPNEDLYPRLERLGIDRMKVQPLGIPIAPVFGNLRPKAEIRRELGLNAGTFTVLITSGGFGIGPITKLLGQIAGIKKPLQILAICGNNPKLKADLEQFASYSIHNIRIYGFVRNMHELMDASDIMVSKSGGLTTTEAMAKGLPLIVLYPIPGQESANCDFILKHQAGLRADSPEGAARLIEELMGDETELGRIRANMSRLGRSQSAAEIVQYIHKLIS